MRQPKNYEEWVATEGAIEHPTHMETLQQPEQQARIQWIKDHVEGTILDVGCNWGYVSNLIGATTGVDVNLENVDKGMREFPHIHFVQADITKPWEFEDGQYHAVVLADVLEHISRLDLADVLKEAFRVAKVKVLITLPVHKGKKYSECFKHQWYPTNGDVFHIWTSYCKSLHYTIHCDTYWVYMELYK